MYALPGQDCSSQEDTSHIFGPAPRRHPVKTIQRVSEKTHTALHHSSERMGVFNAVHKYKMLRRYSYRRSWKREIKNAPYMFSGAASVPQQACAWATQQQWGPEPGSIPPLVCTACRPLEPGTSPAACAGAKKPSRQWSEFTRAHWRLRDDPITAYPCPPRATNISWKGNCRCRSFSMTSTHLGSPGWLSSSWQNTQGRFSG